MPEEEEDTAVEASLEEILAKRGDSAGGDDDEGSVLELDRDDEKAETLTVKVLPPQQNEFTCRSCFLVKHRSQLADKRKIICRDCA